MMGWDDRGVNGTRLYDAQTGVELWSKEDIPGGGLVFTPDGNLLATTNHFEARIQMLAVEDGRVVSNIVDPNCSAGDWLLFNTTGAALLTGRGSGHIDLETTLNLWDVATGRCQKLENRPGFLYFLDVNDDFSLVAMSIVEQDRQVYVWDLEERTDACHLPGDFGLFVPHTNQFVISNAEKLAFYDVSSCQLVKEYTIASPLDGYIAFTPDGERFATAGEYLQLWETATGELLFQEKLPKFRNSSSNPGFIFSPNGEYLLAVFCIWGQLNCDAVIQVWQVQANP
jgi:WD40 repeat protein